MSQHTHPTDLPTAPAPTTLPATSGAPKALRLDLTLAGPPPAHRDELAHRMMAAGWSLQWHPNGWGGTASKGNKVMNFLFGAFAQYHEINFGFVTLPDGQTGLTLYRSGDGCMGGLYGMYKVKKNFRETADEIEGHYRAAGALVHAQGQ